MSEQWKAVPVAHIETLVNHTRDAVVACNGLKCREPNCESCCGEDAHEYIQKAWNEVGAILRETDADTHVAVRKMTETEALAAYDEQMNRRLWEQLPHHGAWLAALRWAGVIKEKRNE